MSFPDTLKNMSKQYLPFAIKYRPQKFSDLIGQEMLVTTLSAAIINNRIANAYLLTGIRGIGKTTSARIIATIMNCEKPVIEGTNIEACNNCNNCKAIQIGNHPDIIEIDAASRTGIDDIRSIIESAEYTPLLGRYKIFIIDEVHMISKNAFNALLKTLEEPPAKVKFIFATTEANKIPITILSRCQRFDLKRFDSHDVEFLLTKIAGAENISFDNEAIKLISLKSEGSARDAISMLDQASLLAMTENMTSISVDLVRKMLAVTSFDIVISFIDNILKQDVKSALEIIQKIYIGGNDIIFFVENLLDIIGYITKLSALSDYKENSYESYQTHLRDLASKTNIEVLTVIWQIFSKGLLELKNSHNQLLSIEMLAIKSIYSTQLPTPREAIEALENRTLPRQ